MDAIRIITTVEQDGELHLSNLPLKKGQRVEMIVLPEAEQVLLPMLSADQLLNSGLIGLWKDREDISDSSSYARLLREQAQHRMPEAL